MNKSKWHKIFICIVVIIMFVNVMTLLFSMFGEYMEDSNDDNQPVIITVWSKDRHDMEFWNRKVDEFNRNNPYNITVNYEVFSENYTRSVENAFSIQQAPDILSYTQQIFRSYETRYANLYDYMDEDFKKKFSQTIIDGINVINDKCYYIPTAATTSRLFYNKNVFKMAGIEEVPQNMDDVINIAQTINERLSQYGVYGFACNFKNAESALNRSLLKQGNIQCGIKAGYDFLNGEYDFEKYEGLIEKWRKLMSEDCSYPNCDSLDIDPIRKLFCMNRIGMYISYTHAEFGAFVNQYGMDIDEWGCAPLPVDKTEITGVQNYSLNNGYLINKNSAYPDKAWLVYSEIFASMDNLKEYYSQGLGISVISEIQDSIVENSAIQKHKELYVNDDDEKIWPLAPLEKKQSFIVLKGADYGQVLKGLIFGNQDIKTELSDLSRRYNAAYQNGVNTRVIPSIKYDGFDPKHPDIFLNIRENIIEN